jgi:4'-phosphopantetheinyl transferase EntD
MTGDVSSFLETWKSLLPSGIRVGAGALSSNVLPLTCSELASVGEISADRKRELQNGRSYAKHALAMFGVHDVDLPVGSDRLPVWPTGFIGSITHTRRNSEGFCAAAVARSDEFLALGIDVEYAVGLDPPVWPTILTVTELSQIRSLPANEREGEAIRRWCVKEAIVKATRRRLEPLVIETENCEADSARYALTQKSDGPERWHARTACWQGLVFAAVAVPLR